MENNIPTRVLQVVSIMNTGGIETLLMNIYRNIDRTKFQFDFVVHTDKKGFYDDEIEKLGGKICHVPRFTVFNFFRYKKAWRILLDNYKSKIIHAHINSSASIFLAIEKKCGYTTILHSHAVSDGSNNNLLEYMVKRFFLRKINSVADIRLACSKEAGNWLFGDNTYSIIKNAINAHLYLFDKDIRNKYRNEYKFTDDNILVGHVGRFSYAKNHLFLIDVFSELYKKNNQYRLVLVGNGELYNEIKIKVSTLGLTDSVIYMGVRSDIPAILQMVDLFVFPSIREGLGISLIEAQAAGLQCFVSDKIPQEAVITKLVCSISLSKAATEWANQIKQYSKYERCNTYLDVKNSGYDIETVVKRYENIYKQ